MIDRLEVMNLKKLRGECNVHSATSNFDQLCRIGITIIAMLCDKELSDKAKAANKLQDRGS